MESNISLTLESKKFSLKDSLEQQRNKYGWITGTGPGKKWQGLVCSSIYGWLAKTLFCSVFSWGSLMPGSGITTCSFLFLVPFVMGLIIAGYPAAAQNSRITTKALSALLAVSVLFILSTLLQKEGSIYMLIALPVFGIMAACGSIAGHYLFSGRKIRFLLLVALLLPFLIAPLESYFGRSTATYTQYTTINIHANDRKVWENIIRVKAITEAADKDMLFRFTGIPRPVKAEFDTIAVGGKRKAVFNRGLIFTETITAFIPDQVLVFNIEADRESKPVSTLEKDLIIDRKYFEVLDGKYEIERTGNNTIKLHLSARYRLATHFNFYSSWWARIIMDRIQKSILEVVKQRSESGNAD